MQSSYVQELYCVKLPKSYASLLTLGLLYLLQEAVRHIDYNLFWVLYVTEIYVLISIFRNSLKWVILWFLEYRKHIAQMFTPRIHDFIPKSCKLHKYIRKTSSRKIGALMSSCENQCITPHHRKNIVGIWELFKNCNSTTFYNK